MGKAQHSRENIGISVINLVRFGIYMLLSSFSNMFAGRHFYSKIVRHLCQVVKASVPGRGYGGSINALTQVGLGAGTLLLHNVSLFIIGAEIPSNEARKPGMFQSGRQKRLLQTILERSHGKWVVKGEFWTNVKMTKYAVICEDITRRQKVEEVLAEHTVHRYRRGSNALA